MAKWNQILKLNREKLDRFFGERTRRSIQTTNEGPFAVKSGREVVGGQSQLEMIEPPNYTFVFVTLIADIALMCNLVRLLYH